MSIIVRALAGDSKKLRAAVNDEELEPAGGVAWTEAAVDDVEGSRGVAEVTIVVGASSGGGVLREVELGCVSVGNGVKFAPVAGVPDGTFLLCCLLFLNSDLCW